MNKSAFLKLLIFGLAFTIIPFLGGLAIGKTLELASEDSTPKAPPTAIQPQSKPAQALKIDNPEEIKTATSTETTQQIAPDQKNTQTPPRQVEPAPKVAGITASTKTETSPACSGTLSQAFLCLLNQYRAEKGFSKLTYNSSLNQVALGHSSWMNTTGNFSHTGINGSRMTDRCAAAGTTCLAENLAENILDAQKLLDSWKATQGHNKNLLGPYTIAGFGISGPYVTLLFN